MNDSAAEFVIARSVAFIDSDDNYCTMKDKGQTKNGSDTYHSLLFDDVNRGVDIILCC